MTNNLRNKNIVKLTASCSDPWLMLYLAHSKGILYLLTDFIKKGCSQFDLFFMFFTSELLTGWTDFYGPFYFKGFPCVPILIWSNSYSGFFFNFFIIYIKNVYTPFQIKIYICAKFHPFRSAVFSNKHPYIYPHKV